MRRVTRLHAMVVVCGTAMPPAWPATTTTMNRGSRPVAGGGRPPANRVPNLLAGGRLLIGKKQGDQLFGEPGNGDEKLETEPRPGAINPP